MRERQKRACADCEWNHGDRVLCSLAPMQMEELHAFPFRKGLVVGPQYPNGGGRLALSLHKPRLPNRMVVSSDGRECVFTFGSADHGLGGNGGNNATISPWANGSNTRTCMVRNQRSSSRSRARERPTSGWEHRVIVAPLVWR